MNTNTEIKALRKCNESKFNRTIKALVKYNQLNEERNRCDGNGNVGQWLLVNRQCEKKWDRFLELLSELPKYEQRRIESSVIY